MTLQEVFRAGYDARRRALRDSISGVIRFSIYAVLGIAVGAIVVSLEWVAVEQLLAWLETAPLVVQAVAPGLGILVAGMVLRIAWRTDWSTSDAYIHAFHAGADIQPRRLLPKMVAAISTIGLGGSAGLEGPSIYAGASLGQLVGRWRLTALGARSDRILLVAGAAAGVAAVFKAPATGVLFALEAPYRRDIARHALIPALVASAASYLTIALTLGTERLFPIRSAELALTDEVFGAIAIGILAGVAARGLAHLFHWAKTRPAAISAIIRIPTAGAVLAVALIVTHLLVEPPLTLGPGAKAATRVVLDQGTATWVIAALFALRAIATSATLGGGGIGGVFIPLAVQGLLLGRIVEDLFDAPANGLYPVVGLAAVLGAGYRAPLAAVMFVAETTGHAEFVIPALLATAVSQALMGDVSVSSGQEEERGGLLERRLEMRADALTVDNVQTLDPMTSLLDVVDQIDEDSAPPALPVCGPEYLGLLVLHDIAPAILKHGTTALVRDATRNIPAIAASDPAIEAARLMNEHSTAAIAVVDENGKAIGIVSAISLTGLRELDLD